MERVDVGHELPSFRAALNLLGAAAGMALLALGLRQWAAIAWARDTSWARTPVPYGTHLELPVEVNALPSSTKWVFILSGTLIGSVCIRAISGDAHSITGAAIAILASDGVVSGLWSCSPGPSGRAIVAHVAVLPRRPAWVPTRGFVVVDRAGCVAYGSYDLSYLGHVLGSLALLD